MDRAVIPAPAHRSGEVVHGFRLERVRPAEDIRALVYEARHEGTGARLLHLHCHDEENLFSVGFETLPADSTGVAHILEHAVLAGSERYPVKDAFNELGKRTLNTFLNAMTWPDRTVYPVCSAVAKDLFNLAEVYLDLCFRPRLSRETFLQEGHHLEQAEPADADSALVISGVVYNEMQGVYASPESLVRRKLVEALLPDTIYAADSGGDPDHIPELTWEALKAFHGRYYAPANARFLCYGDLAFAEHAAFLAPRLDAIAAAGALAARRTTPTRLPEPPAPPPLLQRPRWQTPRAVEVEYPIGPEDDPRGKSFVIVAWALNDTRTPAESLDLDVLANALAGSAAGPVQRALIDSGLGEDLYPVHGYASDLRQGIGAFGLRGTDAEHQERIERIVLDTLARVVEEGLDPALIEAAFHQVEFDGRAIEPPFPVMLLMRANPPWYYGADPLDGVEFGRLVEAARARHAADPRHFEGLIRRWLLDNPHRLRFAAKPSRTLLSERRAALTARLAERRRGMDETTLARIRAEAEALRRAQLEPDPPEAIATLPQLGVADVPARLRVVPMEVGELAGAPLLEHRLFSNGIGYIGLAFDASDIDEDLVPWLPLLGKATLGMGAGGLGYEATAVRVGRTVGGLSADPITGRALRTGRVYERFTVDADVLARNVDAASLLLQDFLTAPDLGDRERLEDLVLEMASRFKSSVVPSGHHYAFRRAAATLAPHQLRREQWDGITQLQLLTTLARDPKSQLDAVAERLRALQQRLFTRRRALVSLGGDAEVVDRLRPAIERLLLALPEGAPAVGRAVPPALLPPGAQGVAIAAEICYTAEVLPVADMTEPAAPALELCAALIDSEHIYKRVRVQGGAYGGYAYYSADEGLLTLMSFRDPKLEETFRAFADVADFIRSGALTDEAIDSIRLGAIGAYDRILAPGQQVGVARRRYLGAIGTDDRQRFRDGLLTLCAADIERLALPWIEGALARAPRAALASRERLARAGEALGAPFTVLALE